MAQILDTFATVFTADNRDFNKKAEQIRETFMRLKYAAEDYAERHKISFEKADKAMNKTTQSLSKFAKRFLSVYAVISTGRAVINEALQVDRLSKSLNMSAENVQAWGHIIQQEGGNLDSFSTSAKKLSNGLNAIPLQGNSPLLVNLNRLGINAYNAGGGIKSVNNVLLELADRFQGMSGAQAMGIGKMLGLDDATVRLLQKGRREVTALLEKNKETSVYSNRLVAGVSKLNKAWLELKQTFMATAGSLLEKMLPALQWGVEMLTLLTTIVRNVIDNFQDFAIAAGIVGGAFAGIKIVQFIGFVSTLTNKVGLLRAVILLWGRAMAITKAITIALNATLLANPIVLITVAIMALIGVVGLIVNDIRAWLNGDESMFGEWYEKIAGIFGKVKDIWNGVVDWFKSKDLGQILLDLLVGLLGKIPLWGSKIKNAIKRAFSSDNDSSNVLEEKQANIRTFGNKVLKENPDTIIGFSKPVSKATNATPLSNTTNNQTTTTNMGGVNITVLSNDPLTAGQDVQQTLINQSNVGGI